MLKPQQAEQHATDLVSRIGALPVGDALHILHLATGQILSRINAKSIPATIAPVQSISPELLRDRRLYRSKIDADLELRDFIHSLRGNLGYDDILTACRERFDANRVPSRSTLHRHVANLKYRCATKSGQQR